MCLLSGFCSLLSVSRLFVLSRLIALDFRAYNGPALPNGRDPLFTASTSHYGAAQSVLYGFNYGLPGQGAKLAICIKPTNL